MDSCLVRDHCFGALNGAPVKLRINKVYLTLSLRVRTEQL